MQNLHELYREILHFGEVQVNRTTTPAIALPYGAMLRYDLMQGFPAVTTKELFFKGVKGEYIGFLRGYTNAEDFAKLGCTWWRKDANENTQWLRSPYRTVDGDMGRAYGAQWRRWNGSNGRFLDQVQKSLDDIRNNPTSRRIIINAWRPDEFDAMCLPPCHVLYNFSVNLARNELNLGVYMRSVDTFLGLPMNIAGAALLLEMFAAATGYQARWLTMHMDNVHIYTNHVDQVKEQITRRPLPLPSLRLPLDQLIDADADRLAAIEPHQIELVGYQSHPPIRGEMSTG